MLIRFAFAMLFILGLNPSAMAQQTVKFLVLDSASKYPVPYARVFNMSRSIGTVSNENGQATLEKTSILDSVLISTIGYENKYVICKGVDEEVLLPQKVYEIKEVVISAPLAVKPKRMPSKIKPSGSLCDFYDKGYQLVAFVNTGNLQPLQEVSIYFHKKTNCSGRIRLVLYNVDPDGLPHENLLPKSIIINSIGLRGWTTFDLRDLNVRISDHGAFAGVELIDFEDDKSKWICLGLSDQFNINHTWVQSVGGKWHQLPFMKNKDGAPYNIMVKIK
jgi:hypothetical protein